MGVGKVRTKRDGKGVVKFKENGTEKGGEKGGGLQGGMWSEGAEKAKTLEGGKRQRGGDGD